MKFKKIIALVLIFKSFAVLADDEVYFKKLDNLYRNKKFPEALVESEKYLEKYPNSKYYKSITDKMGKIYFLEKKYNKTIETFKKLYLNENKKTLKDEYSYYIARSYATLGEKDKSIFYLKNIENKKIFEKANYEIATDFLSSDYNKEAIEILEDIVNNKGSYYEDALLNLGVAFYNIKEYEKSFKILEEFTKISPKKNSVVIEYLKGSSLYKKDRIDEAIKYFDRIVNSGLNGRYNKKSILTLIEIYSNRKDLEKVNYYLQKIQGTEEYNTAMIMIGDLYVTKEKYKEAIKTYHMSNDLKNPRLIYGEAYSLYKLKNYEEALKKFETLKNTDYYNQSIYHIFAINYQLKNYKKIIEDREIIRKVVVTQTDTDNIIRIIANSAYQLGDYKLAKDYYGRLFAISTNLENLFRVILLDSQILDIQDLENRFNQYKKLFPSDTKYKKDIYLYTGDAYFKSGNNEIAEDIYREYLDNYFNLEILSSLLSVLLEEKKYDKMEEYLSLVAEEDKYNYLKGITSIGLGKYEEAEIQLEKAEILTNDSNLKNRIALNRVRNFFLWKNYEKAINIGEEFLKKIKKDKEKAIYSEILDKVGLSYFRLGEYDKAREYYTKITELEGYEVYGKFQIADSYYNQKIYETASEKYKDIFQSYEETFYGEQAYYRYISILKNQNKKDEFENEKNNFLKKYPNSNLKNTLLNLSASYYAEENNTEKAIEAIEDMDNNNYDQDIQDNKNIRIIGLKLKNKDFKDIENYIENLSNTDEKAYYYSKYYSIKKDTRAIKEYEKLLNSDKYSIYASKNLADYWYREKDYTKAKKYYLLLLKLDKSVEEEYIIYRLGIIAEKEKNFKDALSYYKKIYDKYKGKYEIDALVRSAEIYDRQEKNKEAKELFFRLYKVKNNKELHEYTLEKLIYYRLLEENKKEAKRYLEELKKINPKKAVKFNEYFE